VMKGKTQKRERTESEGKGLVNQRSIVGVWRIGKRKFLENNNRQPMRSKRVAATSGRGNKVNRRLALVGDQISPQG